MALISKMMINYWYLNNKSAKKYRKKLTTVKLFRKGKLNIDHVNTYTQATMIREFVVSIIMDNWEKVVYYDE